jgi:hypothetical protein
MIIILSNENDKNYIKYKKEKYKTENMKNIKERKIKFKTKLYCENFELRITDENHKIKKLYNYMPSFTKLFEYFPIQIKTDNKNYSLYSNDNPDKSLKVGFKDTKTAKDSINLIRNKPLGYQIKVINTLYNRAKFHPNQTNDIRKAMKVFKLWLRSNLISKN